MKKILIGGLAVAALLAVTAVAIAQYALPVVTVTAKVSPSKGGTKKKPKNASVSTQFTVNADSHSTVQTMSFLIPPEEEEVP